MSSSSPFARGDVRGRAAWVVFGGLAAQLAMGVIYVRAPATPAIVAEFGWARGDLMLWGSPATFMTAVFSPLAGYLTQRHGARPVLLFGCIWVSILFWGFSEMSHLWHYGVLAVGTGLLVASVGDVAVGSVVSRWIARGRGLALGLVYSGSNLGGAIAAGAAGLLLEDLGWRTTFLVVGCAASAMLVPTVAATVREPPRGYVPPSLRSSGAGSADRANSTDVGLPLSEARRTRTFWQLWIALFLFYLYFIAVGSHLTLYLTDLGLSQRDAAVNYAIMVALGVASKVLFGLVADRFPVKASLLACFAFVSLASVMLIGIEAWRWLLVPFVIVHGISVMAQNVVYPLIVAHAFGTRYMAEIYGVIMLALFPGGIIGPVLAGYMHDWLHSYTAIFAVYAGCTALSLALLAGVRRELPADVVS